MFTAFPHSPPAAGTGRHPDPGLPIRPLPLLPQGTCCCRAATGSASTPSTARATPGRGHTPHPKCPHRKARPHPIEGSAGGGGGPAPGSCSSPVSRTCCWSSVASQSHGSTHMTPDGNNRRPGWMCHPIVHGHRTRALLPNPSHPRHDVASSPMPLRLWGSGPPQDLVEKHARLMKYNPPYKQTVDTGAPIGAPGVAGTNPPPRCHLHDTAPR